MDVIITTSGTGSRLHKYTKFNNKSLVKIGDKCTIDYIIDLFQDLKNINFYITIGYYGNFVKQYLNISYPNIKFNFIEISKYKGDGSSLIFSLLHCKKYIRNPFYYICCDTIIFENINFNYINENTLFVINSQDSKSFSTINIDNNKITKVNNKNATIFDYSYIGMAYIKDYDIFFDYAENIYNNNISNQSLSDIQVYQKMLEDNYNIEYKLIKNYYDMGNLDNYKIANNYFKTKYNVLFKEKESIIFKQNIVVKFFYDSNRIKNIMIRYDKIKDFCPKIFRHSENYFVMELIDSKPLSKIYTNGLIYKLLNWAQNNLWKKIDTKENYKLNFIKFYKDKTLQRIKEYLNQENNKEYETINGLTIENIYDLINKIDFDYLSNSYPTNFHGDFILDNILYKDNRFLLIDWRENFGNTIEYGDLYYDLSKLRHNIFFNHENIENNLFTLRELTYNQIELDLKCNYFLVNQLEDYNKFIDENNYDLKKIKIINSLIWINMAPLHEYPLSNFLFNFGKYNLYLNLR